LVKIPFLELDGDLIDHLCMNGKGTFIR